MNTYSNGFIFLNNNKIYDYLYLKLSPEKLKKALIISYKSDATKPYLTVVFDDGRDYLGQSSYEDIKKIVKKMNMVSLIDNDYEYVKEKIPDLNQEEYESKKNFFMSQLDVQ